MSNASPYEHDGLAPDARFFSSYRPFFLAQSPKCEREDSVSRC